MTPERRILTARARIGLALLASGLLSPLVGVRAVGQSSPRVTADARHALYELRGGQWLTGNRFEKRTMYMSDGRFVRRPSHAADSVVNLAGGYIVPPFAEGHNHWLEPRGLQAYVQSYLRDGVFYVKDQANSPYIRTQIDSALNIPRSVDFVSANQGWTGPGGHPLQIVKQFAAFGVFPKAWGDSSFDRNVVMVVQDSTDIADRWPLFLQGHPAFTKAFLLNSEEFTRRSTDDKFLYRRGINPALIPEIVRRSHAAGLRVSAHIYTAADFRAAVKGGVDDIAHFPGTGIPAEPDMPLSAYVITDADARAAAARGVSVTTTLYWLGEIEDTVRQARVLREVIRPNLALLRKHGVALRIGSDQFRGTSLQEADVLVRLGLFSPRELIRLWSTETPKAIFPKRRVGELAIGAEASFLALDGNPFVDFASVHHIITRVKQGEVIRLEHSPPSFPALP